MNFQLTPALFNKLLLVLPVAILSTLAAAETRHQTPEFEPYWYHQGAEITSYDLVQARYGDHHQGEAVLIYVTEPIDTVQHVKSDNAQAKTAVPGLKLNSTRTFLTGIYPYSVMQTTLQPINGAEIPRALKTSTSIQEWCGHIFEQWNALGDQWQYRHFSYFQQAGDGDDKLTGVWLEDELWTRIRLDPQQLPTGEITSFLAPFTVASRIRQHVSLRQRRAGRIISMQIE